MEEWLKQNATTEVECLVADISGVARGKILPADKFLRVARTGGLRLPLSLFGETVNGDWPDDLIDPTEPDMLLRPVEGGLRTLPWYDYPAAQVICDCVLRDGTPVEVAPRRLLQRVCELYAERGWRPVLAPEIEFYLVKRNTDPDYPLQPPVGRSGRAEPAGQAYGIDAVNEFDPVIEDIYDYSEAQRLDIDTLTHEAGAAQFEINFRHGEPLALADQTFLFKRTVREAAKRHGMYATFMAKPIQEQPGSAMHIHQSVVDADTGQNLFADAEGRDTPLFLAHIAGLQRYLRAAMPLVAPNVNSYRRLQRHHDAPINLYWGHENRTVGLRVPSSEAEDRRLENRIPGADANPYLAFAASLVGGYLGMVDGLTPTAPTRGNAYVRPFGLPRYLPDALAALGRERRLRSVLGEDFVRTVVAVKRAEHDAYQSVISSWEREHLLLNI